MPIVLQDPGIGGGLAQALTGISGGIAEGLEHRAAGRLQQQQQGALQRAIEEADLSSEQGRQSFLASYPGDKKDALATIKQLQPSGLDQILSQYGYGENNNQASPSPGGNQQGALESAVPSEGIHPAIEKTPFSRVPDEVLAMASASTNPREKNFGDGILDARDKAHKRYNEDRNYAHQRTKKYYDDISDLRKSASSQRIALNDIRFGLNNRDKGTSTMDWWASNLSRWTEPLVSAEGNLIQSGVKNYLISDLKGVKGRPNQFLEGLLLQSLPGLGKSDLSNEALATSLLYRADIDDLKIDLTDKLTAMYEGPTGMGPVPANIDRLVSEQMKPIVDEWGDKHAYNLRRIQEAEQGIEGLSSKKVVQGTPLTIEMMTFLADEYGLDKAVKRARQLGYTIPSEDAYKRYSQ